MSKRKILNPTAREALDYMKYEAAVTLNINLQRGYNGDLTASQTGRIGGEMVRRMILQYEHLLSPTESTERFK